MSTTSAMHRTHRSLTALLCLLALWLQMLSPALALGMQRPALDPLSVICHSAPASSPDRPAPSHHTPACDHCVLCHALAGGLPPDGRPVFVRLDHPVASVLRWRIGDTLAPPPARVRDAQPRGPPFLV